MNPKITMVARYLLGLMLLVFGLNKFINFMPALELPPDAATFFGALMDSGYLMFVIGVPGRSLQNYTVRPHNAQFWLF